MTIFEQSSSPDVVQFVIAAGMARWPNIVVEREALGRHLAETPLQSATSTTLAAECYLAFAAAVGAPHALSTLQRLYSDAIDGGARSVGSAPEFVDDVRQRVLELLITSSPSTKPKLLQYRGRGPLGAWLRTTAKRVALKVAGADRAERLVSEETLANELADTCDQELALLRTHYSKLFREALVFAIRSLPADERLLLQMSLVGGISSVRIAKMYQVNQSTISRRLQRAASKTFELVRQKLRSEFGIVSEELESLLDIVRSHIEMTLSCFEEAPGSDSSATARTVTVT